MPVLPNVVVLMMLAKTEAVYRLKSGRVYALWVYEDCSAFQQASVSQAFDARQSCDAGQTESGNSDASLDANG